MALHRICVGYDDSLPARWALAFAERLAAGSHAELSIAHVVAPVAEDADLDLTLPPGTHVLSGRTAEQLVAFARAERADLLVTGTRPLRGSARLVAPRLRHALLASAPCPVVLVRHPPVHDRRTLLLQDGPEATAGHLAAALGATVAHRFDKDPRDAPVLAVTATERFHGLRRRLGASPIDSLIEAVDCPVAVVSRT
jgi:nucleotide-binding universal stress UspA family protein